MVSKEGVNTVFDRIGDLLGLSRRRIRKGEVALMVIRKEKRERRRGILGGVKVSMFSVQGRSLVLGQQEGQQTLGSRGILAQRGADRLKRGGAASREGP